MKIELSASEVEVAVRRYLDQRYNIRNIREVFRGGYLEWTIYFDSDEKAKEASDEQGK